MAQFFDISDWSELSWYNTGGTRAKKFVQSPNGDFYYYKRSQYKPATLTKPGKDFKYEFWSEVIAHHVGVHLGFNVLQYDIAYDGATVGCISKSMVNSENQHFLEGIRFLQGYNPNYDPENKAHRSLYNFQSIEAALDKFAMARFNKDIVETIIFDAIIGNGDRHQENWAIILDHSAIPNALNKLANIPQDERQNIDKNTLFEPSSMVFAPIYDSGSSLGRELTEAKVEELLKSDTMLSSYIQRGLAEIHWNTDKVSHFALLQELLQSGHNHFVLGVLRRVFNTDYANFVCNVIANIDAQVPEFLKEYKIPKHRKEFIAKLIVTRIDELKKLCNE